MLLSLVAMLAVPASATPIVLEFQATADTMLYDAFPDTDYSANPTLHWDTHGGSPGGIYQSLLRFDGLFDDNGGPIPSGNPLLIKSATLRLQESSAGPGDAALLHRMLQDWSDTDTWNSLGGGIQPGQEAALISDADTGAVAPNDLIAVDVLASLHAWAQDPSQNFGWAILPTGADGVAVHSSEALLEAVRPKLEITFVPEPTMLSLLLLGGLVALKRRR